MGGRRMLQVRVKGRDGRPIADARVFIEAGPEPYPDIAALSDVRGEVVMSLPAAGRYDLQCAAAGYKAAHASVDVLETAETSTLVVELNPED